MSSIKLYYFPNSTSTASQILLYVAEIAFELIVVKLTQGSLEELGSVNLKKRIPVVVIDDQIIIESSAIIAAVAQPAPEKHLLGKTNLETIRVYEWINRLSGTLYGKPYRMMLRPERYSDDVSMHDAIKAKSIMTVTEPFAMLEERLRGMHALGDGFTVVDLFLYVFYR